MARDIGGAMKLMVETTNINPLSIQFSTGGTPASIRQINSTLNHQSAILNQSNLSNRLSKLFQSTWLSRLFLWITFLGSLMPLKKTLTMHSLPWAKQRPDGRRGTFSAGHEAMERFLWNMGKICRQGRTISVYHGSWKPHSLTNSDQQSRCVFLPTWY